MYKCDQCDRNFVRQDNLRRHVKISHPSLVAKEGSIVCTNHKGDNLVSNVVNSNNTTNIFLTRDPDFLKKLIELKGGEEAALNALKKAVYHKIRGEVELFGEMYLRGDDPEKWSVVCVDAKTHFFRIKQPDGTWLDDPGAVESRKRFYGNYTDAVLMMMGRIVIDPVVDRGVDLDDFPDRAGTQMDFVDMQSMQCRISEVCSQKFQQELFAKELTSYYFGRLRQIKQKNISTQRRMDHIKDYLNGMERNVI